ncbi:lipopolysaccharide biosynthesis protein [Ulvibacterium marinum]|uniref:MATE family efflux transporter n=1 Tax=Ulvibacterium marinum TaxID=2419782 RepID=A0A3B0C3D9_9FLAO|nr:MATE family efflux transporter [Ulvibacterium marinum]RKN79760.1 MATE family efflux transporter [Ulvibacterium marinum]
MKKTFDWIHGFLGIKSNRTKNITKHISWSVLYKIGSVISNFLLVPLTINHLSLNSYGIWLTISSFIAWFSFLDIGLENGLRNKFAEAQVEGNVQKARALVSSGYFTIGTISLVLVTCFFFISQYIDWYEVFNTSPMEEEGLELLIPLLITLFGLQLVAKLITAIYKGDQKHSIQDKIQFITQIFSLICIWILIQIDRSSLIVYALVFSSLPLLVLLLVNLYAFRTRYRRFLPSTKLWKRKYLKEITSLGFNFFIIQIATVVLFSTDNFIITQLFSPKEVVPYNVTYKYFSIIIIAYTILTTPYWSAFTEAYASGDFNWIKNSVRNIQRIWLIIPVALVIMILMSDWFYEVWVGNQVHVPKHLSISMAFFVAILSFNMVYVSFINGIGKLRLQLLSSIFVMLINIPLSIYFGKYLGFGTTGVILATCFCLLITLVLWPIQYSKLINSTAKGIWNK